VEALAAQHGAQNVIASDVSPNNLYNAARYTTLNVLDKQAWRAGDHGEITGVPAGGHAVGHRRSAPLKAWTLNMDGLLNILEVARERGAIGKPQIFWPSSIAALARTRRRDTPQLTVMDPTTIYGISKLAGERLCEYYFLKYGVDVRSIRYPGIISFKSPPGGGTTDYAIAIFHSALRGERYECFLGPQTTLPMIYMPDAIRATIELMDAPAEN
jgi:nucleoside-diphosphate-sugar epimerase